ncbi:arylamine N-acetyltransferase family protein [Gordonia neofelifaecis]|uniref:Putative acetyltransferase n=1 Tax=Gordonia neofelifaecis NRRL B-59395 TaxID=644548 RepID=F1YJW3_9ACTN|nr:arylamine N-acetyltransferase [Gordonia neofelifaecis]EGD55045.1 putative acetyltransferase [Gordonia neofelifaecis NRRL B-59395]
MTLWHSEDLDLARYLSKLGLAGSLEPTPDTLRDLHRAHVTSIPFENLEIIAGRPILLDLESVQRKLVTRRRGGYCFEHVTLLAAALERLGFRFTALSGRVILGDGAPETRPATHALLVVEFDDGTRYLCDVGFGRGPLEPLPLIDGAEVNQGGWRFRLSTSPVGDLFASEHWTLWQLGEEWVGRASFTLHPQFPIDYAVGNHFVSTSPRSPFTARTFVQYFDEHVHQTLDGTTWTTESPDGTAQSRQLSPAELPDLLADVFGIELKNDDRAAVIAAETDRTTETGS